MDTYRQALVSIGNFDKSCGFICGRADLSHWNPLELCHLLNTTKDYYGELKNLVPAYTMEDERNYVKFSLNNLYHEICHRYIHADREHNISRLPVTCKSVFYIVQHLHYLRTGNFVPTKRELLECVQDEDKAVLELSVSLRNDFVGARVRWRGYDFGPRDFAPRRRGCRDSRRRCRPLCL